MLEVIYRYSFSIPHYFSPMPISPIQYFHPNFLNFNSSWNEFHLAFTSFAGFIPGLVITTAPAHQKTEYADVTHIL